MGGPTDRREAKRQDALGESEIFLEFQERLSRAAKVDRPVLIIGERGTGKELAASRLHYLSPRWDGPLVALNCASLSPTLIESELFGHEAGAFTGAARRRQGRFEMADGGTLFLDEIGNIPLETQEKILRVVEYSSFERVGGTQKINVDVRIIGATNANLPELAKKGKFKEDFLDRLSFEVLYLPPLRYRKEDILLLANHFGARMAHEMGRDEVPQFSDEAIQKLLKYKWPGNIRELKNVVERAVYRTDSDLIKEIEINPFKAPFDILGEPEGEEETQVSEEKTAKKKTKETEPETLKDKIEAFEKESIQKALKQARHNQKKAAELLGLTYHQFRWLLRKYEIK